MGIRKKEIEAPGLDTERVKALEMDEEPRSCRKVCHPYTPVPSKAEPSTHDRIKGRRVIKG